MKMHVEAKTEKHNLKMKLKDLELIKSFIDIATIHLIVSMCEVKMDNENPINIL